MKIPALGLNSQGAIFLATAAVVAVGLVIFLKRQAAEVAQAAGGIVTGNNAITKGTAYEGGGVAGTAGAVVNAASGGVLEDVGSWIGESVFGWTHPEYDPNAPVLNTRKQNVTDSFYNTGGRVLM